MNIVLLAASPAPLPVKLVVACLAGLLPAFLSGRLSAGGKERAAPYLIACGIATIAIHSLVYEDPGILAGFVGLVVGIVVFLAAPSTRASVFAAIAVTLFGLAALGTTLFLRMPPREMRLAIAHIRRCGGVVQQSDNPGTTYRDQWWVTFEHAGINDIQLLQLASDLRALPKLWLTLSNCSVSDQGLAGLANADNLVWLQLDGTQITDAGLLHVSNLSRLERLDLRGTQVSDQGLRSLVNLTILKSLRLNGTAVTEMGAQELQKSLPECNVSLSPSEKQRVPVVPPAGADPPVAVHSESPRN